MLGLCLTLLSCAVTPAMSSLAGPGSQLLVIAGVSGDTTYEREFYEAGKRIVDAARTKYGVPDSMITFLAEHPERDPAVIKGVSTAAEVQKAFAKIKARAKPGDLVAVVLIGHGSSQDRESSMFNLVDTPDMSAADFNKLLAPLAKEDIVFVNAASASGDFIGKLAGKNRVVLTSTVSPMERNYSHFAKHFAAAFADDAADVDKDGKVSILEAFNYGRLHVGKEYASHKLLQSEHARLDDNGDGQGAPEPDYGDQVEDGIDLAWFPEDGRKAAHVFLSGVAPENPKVAELYQEHNDLKAKLLALQSRRSSMDAAAYANELQGILADMVVATLRARWLFNGAKS